MATSGLFLDPQNVIPSSADNWNTIVALGGGGSGDVVQVRPGTNINIGGTTGLPVVNLDDNISLSQVTATLELTVGSGGTDYTFPSNRAVQNGQVMQGTTTGSVSWASVVNSLTASGPNISVSQPSGDVTVALGTILTGLVSVETTDLAIGGVTFPDITTGTSGQVLGIVGSDMEWVDQTSGTVTSVTEGTNISVTGTGSDPIVNLADTISLSNVTATASLTVGAYALPIVDGTSAQVLQTDGSGVVTWETVSGGGVSSVTEGTNISVTGTGSDPIVNLADTISLSDITATASLTVGAYGLPIADGTAGQVLQTDGSGNVTWETKTVAGTTNQVTVTPSAGTYTVSLPSQIYIGNAKINGAYNFPTTVGNPNDVITPSIGSTTTWAQASSLVSLTSTDSNIIFTPVTGGFDVALASTVNVDELTVNSTYSLPTTAGTSGYILQTNGTTTASWVSPTVNPSIQNQTTYYNIGGTPVLNTVVAGISTSDLETLNISTGTDTSGDVTISSSTNGLTLQGSSADETILSENIIIDGTSSNVILSNLTMTSCTMSTFNSALNCNITTLNLNSGTSNNLFQNCIITNLVSIAGNSIFKNCFFITNINISGLLTNLYFTNCNFGIATLTGTSLTGCTFDSCRNIPVSTLGTYIGFCTFSDGTSPFECSAITVDTSTGQYNLPNIPPPGANYAITSTSITDSTWVAVPSAVVPITWTQTFYYSLGDPGLYPQVSFNITLTQDPITKINSVFVGYAGIVDNVVNYNSDLDQVSLGPINDTTNGNSYWFDGTFNYQFATTFGYQLNSSLGVENKYIYGWSIDGLGFVHVGVTNVNFTSGHVWWWCASQDSSATPYPHDFTGFYTLAANA